MRYLKLLWVSLLILCISPVLAQVTDCPEIVETALAAIEEYCAPTERNQACVANLRLEATSQPEAVNFSFDQSGDIVNVGDIQSLQLFPMDESANTWGVVLMHVQANLPDTLPGQNVTFLLFGDVELINNVTEGDEAYTPMQAFYLATGLGDSQCAQAPQSGMVVQTPQGTGQIAFNINGVDISMGSTVMFQAQRGDSMRVTTVNGAATLRRNGRSYPVVAGTYVETPIDDDLEANGDPELPEAYDMEDFESLPPDFFGEDVEIHEPLTDEELEDLYELIDEGQPLCSDDPDTYLPTCEHLPADFGGEECTFDVEANPDLPHCELTSLGDDGDSDGDGLFDSSDACPFYGDIYGTGLDEIGCPVLPPDEDTDWDGFLNSADACPFDGDIYGTGLDESGCPILPPDEDSDGDSFMNSEDACPYDGDIYTTGVDGSGCPNPPDDANNGTGNNDDVDSDFDGLLNSQDSCPYEGDVNGTGVDGSGCPYPPADVDSDGDGYLDSQDSCPYDGGSNGTGVDGSGCPNPPADVDSDGDGYLDSQDSCPYDGGSNGTGVDGSGCPNPPADVDSDGDGYFDSGDACPFEGDTNGTGIDGSGCPNPP